MDDQHNLRAALLTPRKSATMLSGVLLGGVSGLAVVGSMIVYGAVTAPPTRIASVSIPAASIPAADNLTPATQGAEPAAPAAAVAPTADIAGAQEQAADLAAVDVPAADAVGVENEDSPLAATISDDIAEDVTVASASASFGAATTLPVDAKLAAAKPASAETTESFAAGTAEPVVAAVDETPEVDAAAERAAVIAFFAADEIVDPPRIEAEIETETETEIETETGRDVASMAFADVSGPDAPGDSAAPHVSEDAEITVIAMAEPAKPAIQPDQIALTAELDAIDIAAAPADLLDGPAAAAPEFDLIASAAASERALVAVEVSLSSTDAFDLPSGRARDFAALVTPKIDAPATPPATSETADRLDTAVVEALEEAPSAPHASTPVLNAPAVVAVLGAQPPVGFGAIPEPGEISVATQDDKGRDAARRSVLRDEDMAWRRFAAAAPANPDDLPVLAIVIDEIGAYGAPVEEVAALSPMVTTSVIPSTPDAAAIADALRASGREVLVHMPMETYASFDEGPRPILKKMTDQEVRETARWHLSQFDGFVGVNNHLGSKATRDQRVMDALMVELSARGLMFVDSRTTGKSVAAQAALDAGMLAARNSRFIDNEISTEAVMRELNAAAAQARRYGGAVALGNPHPATVRAVRLWMEANDGKTVVVAPITHVATIINATTEDRVAAK